MNDYPPPPWALEGWGIATLGFIDRAAAAAFIPRGAQLLTVAPGKTLGGLFFVSYERGSLAYRELNIVAGLVRVGRRFAFCLTRLYVDSAASLAGGRAIWGVPKELAAFEVSLDFGAISVDVRQGSDPVCRLRCTSSARGLRVVLPLPSFGMRDDALLFFTGSLRSTISLARVRVELPRNGEFSALGLERPLCAFRCDDLMLRVPAPRAVAWRPTRRMPIERPRPAEA